MLTSCTLRLIHNLETLHLRPESEPSSKTWRQKYGPRSAEFSTKNEQKQVNKPLISANINRNLKMIIHHFMHLNLWWGSRTLWSLFSPFAVDSLWVRRRRRNLILFKFLSFESYLKRLGRSFKLPLVWTFTRHHLWRLKIASLALCKDLKISRRLRTVHTSCRKSLLKKNKKHTEGRIASNRPDAGKATNSPRPVIKQESQHGALYLQDCPLAHGPRERKQKR